MQSDIFKYVVTCIKDSLIKDSNIECNIVENFSDDIDKQIKIDVVDIFQTSNDKTGQRIIVDEKLYEVPAQYVMYLKLSFSGKTLEDVLSLYGQVAVYFKDHNNYECGEYNWHGNELNKIFLEPIVRRDPNNGEYLHLDYRIEVQLNSINGTEFVRVEKKNLNANQIK